MKKIIFSIFLLFGIYIAGYTQSKTDIKDIGFIIFAPDTAIFENEVEAKNLLDQYAKSINNISSKEKQIFINGYTAIFDNDVDPIKLSKDRADVIYNELLSRGISSERFNIMKGNGVTDNWGKNNDRRPNRRVTIAIEEFIEALPIISGGGMVKTENPAAPKSETVKATPKKINWKQILKIAAIVLAVVAVALLIYYVIIPAIGAAGTAGAGAGAGGIGKAIKDAARKLSKQKYHGGRFKDLPSIPGTQKHHMPPYNAFPTEMKNVIRDELPSIQMDIKDHKKTLGWGPGNEAEAVRNELEGLLRNGKYKDVVKKMTDDLRTKFPGKYDKAIEEYLVEANKFEKTFLEKLKGK